MMKNEFCLFTLTLAVSLNALSQGTFTNPIAGGADPWVVRTQDGGYLWCFSERDLGVGISKSKTLTAQGEKRSIWKAPATGPYSKEVWAPELHFLDNRWHIYFAASDGNNANHLAYVLRSENDNPDGPYTLHGPLATGDGADGKSPNIWAIDMTVFTHKGKRYAVWSGWDAPGTDRQFLYIAPMKSPIELAGPRVRICANDDYLWEKTEGGAPNSRGLNEAPQVFDAGSKIFLFYSCGASWLPTYKIGRLDLIGDDPLKPGSWKKLDKPAFESTAETFGVGHSCFVKSPDNKEWWHVFHAKRGPEPGWNRAIFVQPMTISPNGEPLLGKPVSKGDALKHPSG